MGNTNEKNSNYDNAVLSFSDKEKSQLTNLYDKLCEQQKLVPSRLNSQTQAYLPVGISQNLYQYMVAMETESTGSISREGFVITVAHGLKGSLEDKTALFTCMACGALSSQPTLAQIKQFVLALYDGYAELLTRSPTVSSWKLTSTQEDKDKLTAALIQGLIAKDGTLQSETESPSRSTEYTSEQLERWLSRSALLLSMFDAVLRACFPISCTEEVDVARFPVCSGVDWSQGQTLLSLPAVVYLNSRIPHDLRNRWHLLFTSQLHGESFSTMYKRVANQGPTVFIVKDTNGHVFGGFAADSWSVNPKFYGRPQCFLFSIHPVLEAYYPTGYNENYMYFNHSQETLPNGLGMGGQFDYYGLWISDAFDRGQSRAEPHCSTYGSPQLSAEPHFELAVLEVWRVGAEPKEKGEGMGAGGSILDKDPGAKALLTLIDKAPHSDGLREGDATADSPEDRELYPEHPAPSNI